MKLLPLILKTSEEWQKLCTIKVRDPDGWHRDARFEYEWYEEKITSEEFLRRCAHSTISFDIAKLEEPWRI